MIVKFYYIFPIILIVPVPISFLSLFEICYFFRQKLIYYLSYNQQKENIKT